MEELVSCKKVIAKALPGAPNEILLVLDGTTGLNMLQQAREFNDVVGVTGFVLTKLDGTARGGCVVYTYSLPYAVYKQQHFSGSPEFCCLIYCRLAL
jgi:signal recognition particle GTPase